MNNEIETRSNLINWDEIPMDTKVLVSGDGIKWFPAHFAMYDDGCFYAWEFGKSSQEVFRPTEFYMVRWNYYKLLGV